MHTKLFITVKLEPLINDLTAQIKRTVPAELFHSSVGDVKSYKALVGVRKQKL
jgi:hypothetical protein